MALSKRQEYELIKRCLGNPNALKNFLKTQEISWCNAISEQLKEIVHKLNQEYELELQEAKEREAKRLSLIAMIEAEGWSLEALMQESGSKKSKPMAAKKEYKYRFLDEKGKEKGWSGYGMMPKALRMLLDQGHNLEEFLIKKEQGEILPSIPTEIIK